MDADVCCNEVAEPGEAKGLEYGKKQIDLIHELDATRPVTCGLNLMVMSRYASGQGIYKDGELLGFGSANPRTEERFDEGTYTTYYGTALAAVRVQGNTVVTVSGKHQSAKATIRVE